MKKILLAALFLAIPALTQAQTATLQYEYTRPLAEVNQYVQEIKINNVVLATAPTCVATNANLTTCSVLAPALAAAGTHTVDIAATRAGITARTVITGIGGPNSPVNPNNPKVVITITVAVGG